MDIARGFASRRRIHSAYELHWHVFCILCLLEEARVLHGAARFVVGFVRTVGILSHKYRRF